MIGNVSINLSFREFQALLCLFEDFNFSRLDFPNACGLEQLQVIRYKLFMMYQDMYSNYYSLNPDALELERRRFFGDVRNIVTPFSLSAKSEQ